MSRKFITQEEAILFTFRFNGKAYMTTDHEIGKVYETAKDVISEDDRFIKAWRLDTRTMLAPEDVTEDLADAWLDGFTGDPEESNLPAFVENSEAWERFCEAYYTKHGVFKSRRYFPRSVVRSVAMDRTRA